MIIRWLIGVLVGLVLIYDLLPLGISRVLCLGVVRAGPKRQAVSLTFDDGPDDRYTPRLLDVLAREDVQATFFVIAEKAKRYPDIIRRMVAEGHRVEVHGLTHACVPLLMPRRSAAQVVESKRILEEELGVRPAWYRPTWGMINLSAWIAARRAGLRFITWSIMVGDWRHTKPDVLESRIVSRLHPGAVIVLHDSDETAGAEPGAPDSVIEMVPSLVRQVTSRGYAFELLSNWM